MITALIIIASIITLLALLVFVAKRKMKNIPSVADHQKILTLTEQNFMAKTKGKIVLVDFWASWCAPCRMMAPILNSAVPELNENTHIGKVNIEQFQNLAKKFKVRSIPTMVIFKNGVEIKRFSGVRSKEFILQQINSIPN